MQIYWSIKDIPELANLTPEQQKQAWRACYSRYVFKHWEPLASLVLLGVLIAIGIQFLGVIGGIIGGGLGGGIFGIVSTNVLRPHLREYVEKEFSGLPTE
jgi:hypothetical protein